MLETPPEILVIPEKYREQIKNYQIILIGSLNPSKHASTHLDINKLGVRLFLKEKSKWIGLFLSWHYQLDAWNTTLLQSIMREVSLLLSKNQHSLHDKAKNSNKDLFLTRYLHFLKDNSVIPRMLLPIDAYVLAMQSLKHLFEDDDDVGVVQELGLKLHVILSMQARGKNHSCGFLPIGSSQLEVLRDFVDPYPLIWGFERDVKELDELGMFDDDEIHQEVMKLLMKTLSRHSGRLVSSLSYGLLVEDAWKLANFLEWLFFHPDSKQAR